MGPALVFVHGIGAPRDPDAERASWLAALAVGARRAGHSRQAEALARRDLDDTVFVHYADLFTTPHAQSAAPPADPASAELSAHLLRELIGTHLANGRDPAEERILLHAQAELTAVSQAQGGGDLVRRTVNVCTTLLGLPGLRRAGAWASGRLMAGHLTQVARYLARGEPDGEGHSLDRRVRERVLDALDTERPAVVVAHSLGSVVALEALDQHDGHVPLFVTLGSPIGMRTVVLPRLHPSPPATPDCVERWLNAWDRDDIIVPRPLLEHDLLPNASGCVPQSERVDSDGVWTHTATKYLAHPGVAGPVVEALRHAGERASA
ncbi:pimeloyl-ACP methyl ester carboxylesterase [Streptomyces sp. SAI-170]|uniref:alpha/beta hydrolase n=1 Tax=Streptomyces sp. SAI-170 TaxID=3377729 RepID=UPI003C7B9C17